MKPEVTSANDKSQDDVFVAFMFDADNQILRNSPNYATPCERAFLNSITQTKGFTYHARLQRGDILIHKLAEQLDKLALDPSPILYSPSKSTSWSIDKRILGIAINAVCQALSINWHTFNRLGLPNQLGSRNIYCLTAFPMKLEAAREIDFHLKTFEPFIGSAELSMTDPILMTLFHRLLDCAFISKDKIYLSAWETGEGAHQFGDAHPDFESVVLEHSEYCKAAPARPEIHASTTMADATKKYINEINREDHFKKVSANLEDKFNNNQITQKIELTIIRPDADQLHIPVEKLLSYSLNLEHASGKHKARLFSELLEIKAEHWRFLAYQLIKGLPKTDLEHMRVTAHGIQYSALIPVIGTNAHTYTIETAWIIRPSSPAQLVTAFPADKNKQRADTCLPPPWIESKTSDNERWALIYEVAHSRALDAAKKTTPTPMFLSNYETEPEGVCGLAYLKLEGNCEFSSWILDQELGRRIDDTFIMIRAQSYGQSLERAIAYCNEFKEILWLNGIDNTSIESFMT